MPTFDSDPCPVEVPIVRGGGDDAVIRVEKAGRKRLIMSRRDFSVWLTKERLMWSKAGETENERQDRLDVMRVMCGGKPIKHEPLRDIVMRKRMRDTP